MVAVRGLWRVHRLWGLVRRRVVRSLVLGVVVVVLAVFGPRGRAVNRRVGLRRVVGRRRLVTGLRRVSRRGLVRLAVGRLRGVLVCGGDGEERGDSGEKLRGSGRK